MKYGYSILTGVVFGLIGAGVALSGYGTLLFYGRYPIMVLSILLALPALFRKPPAQFVVHGLLIAGIAAGTWQGGVWARKFQKLRICREMDALIHRAEEFLEANGRYPETLGEGNVPPKLSLNVGRVGESGIDLAGVNNHDATVYMSTNRFTCVVPVTKRLPVSITRLYAYTWTSEDPGWRHEKIVWFIGGI